jgi:hypothetical protein
MPSITVYNLYTSPLTLPGGYYTSAIGIGEYATFTVPEIDSYVESASFAAMVTSGYIRWEASSGSMAYNYQLVSYGGGGLSTTATVKGIAATDCVFATLNGSTNAVYVTKAVRTAANTVTITFSGDPGASTTVALMVMRP